MEGLQKSGLAVVLALCVLGVACTEPLIVKQTPGTIPSATFPSSSTSTPSAGNPVQPAALLSSAQTNDAYRWAYAMDTANKAAQLGAILGGPFGGPASMGMGVLGLLYGAVTAESKIAEETARAQDQYQKETAKDQNLEAAIEQELERQRAFENQIAGTTAPTKDQLPSQLSQLPDPVSGPAVTPGGVVVASLTQPATASAPRTAFKNVEIKDLNNDGIADLWIYYNPRNPGEVLREEESSQLDGRVDTWSYFRDGNLVRRDVDNHGYGRPDSVYYYNDRKIVREERDEAGDGRISYRAYYEDGRVAKVERETRGNGRADVWITYDTTSADQLVLKEERDLNGDGFPDLWCHYDGGRLVRRDLNAIGLELFSKQEEAPLRNNAGTHSSDSGT
jgi:hypothetical protein